MRVMAVEKYRCAACGRGYIAVNPDYKGGCLSCGGAIAPIKKPEGAKPPEPSEDDDRESPGA